MLTETRLLVEARKRSFEEVCIANKAELVQWRAVLAALVECRDRGRAMLADADRQLQELNCAADVTMRDSDARAIISLAVTSASRARDQIAIAFDKVQKDIARVNAEIEIAARVLDRALEGVAAMSSMLGKLAVVAEVFGLKV